MREPACQPNTPHKLNSFTQLLLAENVPEEKHAGSFQIQKLLHLVEAQETSAGCAAGCLAPSKTQAADAK